MHGKNVCSRLVIVSLALILTLSIPVSGSFGDNATTIREPEKEGYSIDHVGIDRTHEYPNESVNETSAIVSQEIESVWAREYEFADNQVVDTISDINSSINNNDIIIGGTTNGSNTWTLSLNNNSIAGEYSTASDVRYYEIVQTQQNELFVTGSRNGDGFAVKIQANGTADWIKTYGSSVPERFEDIVPTEDGGALVAGVTGARSSSGWVLKLDKDGNIQWSKTFGGDDGIVRSAFRSAIQTSDGGYVLVGINSSSIINDGWVVKLSSSGSVEWKRTIGSIGVDFFEDVIETDGGYVVAGSSANESLSTPDARILKFSQDGSILWVTTVGDEDSESFQTLQITSTGFLAAGKDGFDGVIYNFTNNGEVVDHRSYSKAREFRDMTRVANGDVYVAGETIDNPFVVRLKGQNPLPGIVAYYDSNNNGDISIGELADAAIDFSSGEITIAQLSDIARSYANN